MKNPIPLPPLFLERLKKILTAENYDHYINSLFVEKKTCFRVNTLKTNAKTLINALDQQGILTQSISWYDQAYYLIEDQKNQLTRTTEFSHGWFYVQNPASIFASLVLNPQPGKEVLDLAAAPGGKTLHLACLMENSGRIAAVESVRDRFFRLKNNIDLAGASIVQAYCKDGAKVWRHVPKQFDCVLLDAPCSSEGRFTLNDSNSFKYWSDKKILDMNRKQKQLLYSAIQCLKPNGRLLYCTCSFAPEENEVVINHIFKKFPGQLELLPITVPFENYQPGLTAWKNKTFVPEMVKAIRIVPNEFMIGFFICLLRKIG